jgi:hypothetical protein
MNVRSAARLTALAPLLFAPALPRSAAAQWVQVSEQFYLPASHNWAFRENYAIADRLFNAFDYGHAILYETLYATPDAPVDRLEQDRYRFIVNDLLVKPPRVPLVEEAIEGQYAKLAPEAKMMFEWAHLLHRQIYDVYGDDTVRDKQAAVDELVRYYRSRPDLAFSTVPKAMVLMEGQPYSLVFRKKYPKFNGLIWAYHWLQVGLYEPMITGRTADERQKGVTAAVARFWSMLEDPPSRMPTVMPMTAAVAPEFTRRHPEAAAIFDNLHSMHDVISDILASPVVPRDKKREAILAATARYRDDTTEPMMREDWLEMAHRMGVENMGGPAHPILPPPPEGGMQHGAGDKGGMQHEPDGRDEVQQSPRGMGGMDHEPSGTEGVQQEDAGAEPERGKTKPADPAEEAPAGAERHGEGAMNHGTDGTDRQ